jgi:hypothetical protein
MDEQEQRESDTRKEREQLERSWLQEQVQLIAIEDGFAG